MTQKTKATKESKLKKIMKAPIRALIKIRDLYIQSMAEFSGHFDTCTVMGCPATQATALPRSFSVTSAKSSGSAAAEDFRELVRAASARSLGSLEKQRSFRQPPARLQSGLPKSHSVGIARIDEDKPCEFADVGVMARAGVYPRSRSYAFHRRKMV